MQLIAYKLKRQQAMQTRREIALSSKTGGIYYNRERPEPVPEESERARKEPDFLKFPNGLPEYILRADLVSETSLRTVVVQVH